MSNGNIFRRLPKNFKLPEYLSDEQKEKIIYELWECETVELNVFI